jgi:hypothetical protein
MMISVRHQFSAFAPENTPILRENQYNYIRFDSIDLHSNIPEPMIPSFHYSTIPIAERSGAKFNDSSF